MSSSTVDVGLRVLGLAVGTLALAIFVGVAAELWHASWFPCNGLLPIGPIRACLHPAGFLVDDFVIIAVATALFTTLIVGVVEVGGALWTRKNRERTDAVRFPTVLGIASLLAGVVLLSSFAMVLTEDVVAPIWLYSNTLLTSPIETKIVWTALTYMFLFLPPVLSALAVGILLRSRMRFPHLPVVAGLGALIGAVLGLMSPFGRRADPTLLGQLQPFLEPYFSFYAVFLLAPLFA